MLRTLIEISLMNCVAGDAAGGLPHGRSGGGGRRRHGGVRHRQRRPAAVRPSPNPIPQSSCVASGVRCTHAHRRLQEGPRLIFSRKILSRSWEERRGEPHAVCCPITHRRQVRCASGGCLAQAQPQGGVHHAAPHRRHERGHIAGRGGGGGGRRRPVREQRECV
jgi:hypothetical protein